MTTNNNEKVPLLSGSAAATSTGSSTLPSTLEFTRLDEIPKKVAQLRAYFRTGATKPFEWRRAQLRALGHMLTENQTAFEEALYKDLKKVKQ